MSEKLNNNSGGTAVTVGTFDGVHLGHRAVLRYVGEEAGRLGLRPLAFTFDRHPLEIVAPDRAPEPIMDAEERDAVIKECGVEPVVVEFTDEVRRKTAAEWMRELVERYDARLLVLGYDNSFGCDGGSMTAEDFIRVGGQTGLKVEVAPMVPGCSSTAVRRAVKAGRMESAAHMLGRPFSLRGEVVHGREIGRTIGVPTANIRVDARRLLPLGGVYAATVLTGLGEWKAVVNVGSCPTVSDEGRVGVEAHLIGFSGDLYGRDIVIRFHERLRDEKKFDGIERLQEQIRADIETVKSKNLHVYRRD